MQDVEPFYPSLPVACPHIHPCLPVALAYSFAPVEPFLLSTYSPRIQVPKILYWRRRFGNKCMVNAKWSRYNAMWLRTMQGCKSGRRFTNVKYGGELIQLRA